MRPLMRPPGHASLDGEHGAVVGNRLTRFPMEPKTPSPEVQMPAQSQKKEEPWKQAGHHPDPQAQRDRRSRGRDTERAGLASSEIEVLPPSSPCRLGGWLGSPRRTGLICDNGKAG